MTIYIRELIFPSWPSRVLDNPPCLPRSLKASVFKALIRTLCHLLYRRDTRFPFVIAYTQLRSWHRLTWSIRSSTRNITTQSGHLHPPLADLFPGILAGSEFHPLSDVCFEPVNPAQLSSAVNLRTLERKRIVISTPR